MDQVFYIYALFRIDGTVCYIGKGKADRWTSHERRKRFRNNFLKGIVWEAKRAGRDLPKIKIREDITEDEAHVVEIALIGAIGRRNIGTGPLANLTDGGEGVSGLVLSASARARMSAAKRGSRQTPESNAKRSVTLSGRKKTPEHVEAAAAAQRGKPKVWTEEGRARFVAAHTGKQWHLGFRHSDATKAMLREKAIAQHERKRAIAFIEGE